MIKTTNNKIAVKPPENLGVKKVSEGGLMRIQGIHKLTSLTIAYDSDKYRSGDVIYVRQEVISAHSAMEIELGGQKVIILDESQIIATEIT